MAFFQKRTVIANFKLVNLRNAIYSILLVEIYLVENENK